MTKEELILHRKNALQYFIIEKQKELEKFRNMETVIQADIASYQKQIADLEKEIPIIDTK